MLSSDCRANRPHLGLCPEANITEVMIECQRDTAPDAQTALFRLLCAMDAPIMQLVTQRDTLEDAFLRATSAE